MHIISFMRQLSFSYPSSLKLYLLCISYIVFQVVKISLFLMRSPSALSLGWMVITISLKFECGSPLTVVSQALVKVINEVLIHYTREIPCLDKYFYSFQQYIYRDDFNKAMHKTEK